MEDIGKQMEILASFLRLSFVRAIPSAWFPSGAQLNALESGVDERLAKFARHMLNNPIILKASAYDWPKIKARPEMYLLVLRSARR